MPCIGSHDGGLRHKSLIRKEKMINMRKWLAEEISMPELLKLEDDIKIQEVLARTGMKEIIPSARAQLQADNEEIKLCHAIRDIIGYEKFEEFMSKYNLYSNEEARELSSWYFEHKKRDQEREARGE